MAMQNAMTHRAITLTVFRLNFFMCTTSLLQAQHTQDEGHQHHCVNDGILNVLGLQEGANDGDQEEQGDAVGAQSDKTIN